MELEKYSDILDSERESFCQHIVAEQGIANSYNKAFKTNHSEERAKQLGYELLQNDVVAERIYELSSQIKTYNSISKEGVAVLMKRVMDISPIDYYDILPDGRATLKPKDEWTIPMKAALESVKFTKYGTEIKLVSKIAASELLCNLMGYKLKEVESVSIDKFRDYSDEELAKMLGNAVSGEEVEYAEEIK